MSDVLSEDAIAHIVTWTSEHSERVHSDYQEFRPGNGYPRNIPAADIIYQGLGELDGWVNQDLSGIATKGRFPSPAKQRDMVVRTHKLVSDLFEQVERANTHFERNELPAPTSAVLESAGQLRDMLAHALAMKVTALPIQPDPSPTESAKAKAEQDGVAFQQKLVLIGIGTGIFAMAAVLLLVFFAARDDGTVSDQQFLFLRIVTALGGGGFAMSLTGFINIQVRLPYGGLLNAGGSFAMFVVLYFFSPGILPSAESESTQNERTIERESRDASPTNEPINLAIAGPGGGGGDANGSNSAGGAGGAGGSAVIHVGAASAPCRGPARHPPRGSLNTVSDDEANTICRESIDENGQLRNHFGAYVTEPYPSGSWWGIWTRGENDSRTAPKVTECECDR